MVCDDPCEESLVVTDVDELVVVALIGVAATHVHLLENYAPVSNHSNDRIDQRFVSNV